MNPYCPEIGIEMPLLYTASQTHTHAHTDTHTDWQIHLCTQPSLCGSFQFNTVFPDLRVRVVLLFCVPPELNKPWKAKNMVI